MHVGAKIVCGRSVVWARARARVWAGAGARARARDLTSVPRVSLWAEFLSLGRPSATCVPRSDPRRAKCPRSWGTLYPRRRATDVPRTLCGVPCRLGEVPEICFAGTGGLSPYIATHGDKTEDKQSNSIMAVERYKSNHVMGIIPRVNTEYIDVVWEWWMRGEGVRW